MISFQLGSSFSDFSASSYKKVLPWTFRKIVIFLEWWTFLYNGVLYTQQKVAHIGSATEMSARSSPPHQTHPLRPLADSFHKSGRYRSERNVSIAPQPWNGQEEIGGQWSVNWCRIKRCNLCRMGWQDGRGDWEHSVSIGCNVMKYHVCWLGLAGWRVSTGWHVNECARLRMGLAVWEVPTVLSD